MTILKTNQSLQIVISETKLIMVWTLPKSKLILIVKPTNLRLIKQVEAKSLTSTIFVSIYLKDKDLQLFVLCRQILLKKNHLQKKQQNRRY